MINFIKGGKKGGGKGGQYGQRPNNKGADNPKGGKPGKGTPGKGGGKGTNGARPPFAGNCYECGTYGHRAFECPKRTRLNNLGYEGEDQGYEEGADEQQDDGTWDLNQASGDIVDADGKVLKCLTIKEPKAWKT